MVLHQYLDSQITLPIFVATTKIPLRISGILELAQWQTQNDDPVQLTPQRIFKYFEKENQIKCTNKKPQKHEPHTGCHLENQCC